MNKKYPKVVKEGTLEIDGYKLIVCVLDNGQRVISKESLDEFCKSFFGMPADEFISEGLKLKAKLLEKDLGVKK